MKRIVCFVPLTVISLVCFMPTKASSQDATPRVIKAAPNDAQALTDEDIQMLRKDIRSQRKQIIAVNMPLSDAEAEKFWPVYEQYVSDLVKINGTKYALIKQYVKPRARYPIPKLQRPSTNGSASINRWQSFERNTSLNSARFCRPKILRCSINWIAAFS